MVARKLATAVAVVLSVALVPVARADLNIGVTLSATGPAASLGIPEKNTFELLPTTIAGEKINWIVLDDGGDGRARHALGTPLTHLVHGRIIGSDGSAG